MRRALQQRSLGFVTIVSLFVLMSPMRSHAQTDLAESFDDLQAKVKVGDRLVIKTADGKDVGGKLVRLGGDDIEIEAIRWSRTRKRAFAETSVRRIWVMDSTVNGGLIGLVVGAAAVGIPCVSAPEDRLSGQEMACFGLVFVPLVGYVIGSLTDRMFNRLVYEAPGGAKTTLLPMIAPHKVGLVARMSF